MTRGDMLFRGRDEVIDSIRRTEATQVFHDLLVERSTLAGTGLRVPRYFRVN
jgi:hypothetical protein